jgi:hypothetical protein
VGVPGRPRPEAAAEVGSFADPRFVFRGFDLVELQTGFGALVNCGGFDRAFAPTNLSDCGLLADLAKALEVQDLLRAEYPDKPHADCDVWAIADDSRPRSLWRSDMSTPGRTTFEAIYAGKVPWGIGRPRGHSSRPPSV